MARHARLTDDAQWRVDLDHYLELLQHKPAALKQSLPLRQARQKGAWPKVHDRLWSELRAQHPVFGLAGLSDPATDKQPAGFVILTTQPNEQVAPYHNRMPAMLAPADAKAFIQGSPETASAMIQPYSASAMRAHRVSPAMNCAGHDGPECIIPI